MGCNMCVLFGKLKERVCHADANVGEKQKGKEECSVKASSILWWDVADMSGDVQTRRS
jgi:hypothetical protein